MKRLLNIFILLFILLIAGSLTRLPTYSHIVFPVCFALSVLIVIGALGYIKFGLKKKLFVWILAALLFLPMNASFCQSASLSEKADEASLQEMANYNNKHKDEVCKYVDEKDKEGNKNKEAKAKMYDAKILDIAQKIVSNSARLNSSNYSRNNNLDEAYRCAKAYVEKVGEIQKSFSKKCSPFTVMIKSYLNKETCWPCDVTGAVLNAIQKVAVSSYNTVRDMSLILLGVMFLFWLGYVTIVFFGKFGFARISEYLTNVLNKAVLVIIVAALLHAPLVNVYRITISPAVQYAAGLAISISNIGYQKVHDNQSLITVMARFMGGKPKCSYCNNTGDRTVGSNNFMDQGTVNSLLCMVCQVYKQVSPMISLGQAIMCYASAAPKSNASNPSLAPLSAFAIPSFTGLFIGAAYVILFSLLMMIVGFHIMGATLRLGFLIILMPLWMVLFIFKTTRSYTQKAWTLLMHALCGLIGLSIAVGIILVGFNNLVPTAALLRFLYAATKSSPTELVGSFAGMFDGSDPLSEDKSSGDSWSSGITDTLVDYALDSLAGYSPMQTVFLFILFGMLSLNLIDKAAEYMERLLGAFIYVGNVGAQSMVEGASTGLKAIGTMGKAGSYVLGGLATGAAAGTIAKNVARSNAKKYKEETQGSSGAKANGTTEEGTKPPAEEKK